MVPPKKQLDVDVNDEEITRLRDVVLRWVEAKKESRGVPPTDRASLRSMEKQSRLVSPVKAKKWPSIRWGRITLYGTAILVVSITIVVSGMLFAHWDNRFIRVVSRVIPIPVAVVNANVVSYYDWVTQVHSLTTYYAHTATADQPTPSRNELQRQVLDRLIEQRLVKALAKRYTIVVTPEEINKQTEVLIGEVGSRDLLAERIHDLYDWSIEEFQHAVIEPFLLKNKLGLALTLDDRLNYNQRLQAEELLEKIKKGPDSFEQIASKYSQDVSAVQGGDLGYFHPTDMVPEFAQAVTALQPGETSGVVKTIFGYHIIKLVEILESDDGKDTQVHAKHILIRSNGLAEYINQSRDQSYIMRLVVIK